MISETETDHRCSKCDRTFKSKRGLNIHLRSCKNEEDNISANITTPDVERNLKDDINYAYEQIVFWKKDFFDLPKCAKGKEFIREITRFISNWSSNSPERDICMKALMVMPSLLLLRVSKDAKTAENKQQLERRFGLWKEGKIIELVREAMAIHLPTNINKTES